MPGETSPAVFKIKATTRARAGPAYKRYFARAEVADATTLRSLLGFAHALGRWPPDERGSSAAVDHLGFASHTVDADQRSVFFSWLATGDKGDRLPPLRIFFYLGTDRGVSAAFIVLVIEEWMFQKSPRGVLTRVAELVHVHRSDRGVT